MAPVMSEEGEEAAEVIRRERQKKISICWSGMHEKVFQISFSKDRWIVISGTTGMPIRAREGSLVGSN